jgi:PERQ amino acid-rich with GYF domain-containing protein
MQKWYDDGYFTPDLPMKRIHLDTTWSTLEQLRRRCPSDRIFLTPLHAAPPGLSMRNDSPSQYNGIDNGPYQPSPIRSLRTSTLESYISTGSNHSESPSSSFGAGRFGDSPPEPSAFNGRVAGTQFYNGDPTGNARGSGFQTTPEIPAAFSSRRGVHVESPVDGSMGMRSGAFATYGYSNPFGSAQSPWGTPTNNFGPGYELIGPVRDAHDHSGLQNYASPGLDINYSSLRDSQDPIVDSTMNYTVSSDHSARVLGGDQQYTGANVVLGAGDQLYSHAAQQLNAQQQPSSVDLVHPQQEGLSAVPTQQAPWPDAEASVRRDRPFDNSQPTVGNIVTQSLAPPSHTSVWDQQINPQLSSSIPIPRDASPWALTSHGMVDNAWGEPAEDTSTNAGPQAVVEARQSPVEQGPAGAISDALEEPKIEPETVESVSTPALPVATPPTSGKSRKQKEPKAPAAQVAPPLQLEVPSPPISAPKLVWQKEDDTRKAISLREIQEAESKKAEAKKAAERERDRAARAAAASSPDKEDIQGFTTSWGLPTSQAGSRSSQTLVKEATSVPTPAVAAPVWTNAPKIIPTKKTMKEILEEEEKRKKAAPQVTAALAVAASTPRRLYTEPSIKV